MNKASLLNEVFSQNINDAIPLLSEFHCQCFMADSSSALLGDILCTEQEIFNLLNALEANKPSGPDEISGKMIKGTAISTTLILTEHFNLSITSGTRYSMVSLYHLQPLKNLLDGLPWRLSACCLAVHSGNKYVLTVWDYVTCYLEAVPLHSMMSTCCGRACKALGMSWSSPGNSDKLGEPFCVPATTRGVQAVVHTVNPIKKTL